jgi:hypothetical protein
MEADNTLAVRFKVSLDGVRRLFIKRLDFLLSKAVIVGFLGYLFSEAVAPVTV